MAKSNPLHNVLTSDIVPKGNHGPYTKANAEPTALIVKLQPPAWVPLSDAERDIFADLVKKLPPHMHRDIDTVTLANLAVALNEQAVLTKFLAKKGYSYKYVSTSGAIMYKPRPEAKRLEHLSRQIPGHLRTLGLWTAQRQKLAPGSSGPTLNKLSRWA